MDRVEAERILKEQVLLARGRTYGELCAMLGEPECVEVAGESGTEYQVETEVFWDSEEGGDLRVMVAIDDGGWRAFAPLTEDFILTSGGEFVGE